ncbi:M20/M25/M40 family metallo-hydrolase [Aquabacterium sp.]|uniref:M20/M25/M40 family metallo-hydrolase n=1 Tax=Aquabacterium sp. TaxID=1872578 RepID=UPI0035B4698C
MLIKTRRRGQILAAAMVLGLIALRSPAQAESPAKPQAPDWPEWTREAQDDLLTYLRFDTTNPPGNEAAAARWLAGRLERGGLDVSLVEHDAQRASVVARLKGRGVRPPLLLVHHIDVVPAHGPSWGSPPFEPVVRDGAVVARGALDDKGPGMMQAAALLALRRSGTVLDRDVVLLAVADEEAGGHRGMVEVLRSRPELSQAGLAIVSDNGFGLPIQGVPMMPIVVAEKGQLALRITLSRTAGHASQPGADNAIDLLSRAMERVVHARAPVALTPAFIENTHRLGHRLGGIKGWVMQHIEWPLVQPLVMAALDGDPMIHAVTHRTVAWTGLHAGDKINVIPGEAEAWLDVRLLPGDSPDDALRWVRDALDLPDAQIAVVERFDGTQTPFDNADFVALERSSQRAFSQAVTTPAQTPASSDARYLRAAGIPTLGFTPLMLDRALVATVHGANERLPLDGFAQGIRCFYDYLQSNP